jgi:two-component system, NarL family, nitrate/nitrite response regulator NarL
MGSDQSGTGRIDGPPGPGSILQTASGKPQEIRILLVHAHDLFRVSLEHLLRTTPGFQVAGSCSSPAAALNVLQRQPIDILLADYGLGLDQVFEAIGEARKAGFEGRVLITAVRMSIGAMLRTLERGASGIILRRAAPSELIDAVHAVIRGRLWLDSEAVKAILGAVRSGEHRLWQLLSARECAVLNAVLEGLTNHQIAVRLQIPKGSVKYVLGRLFEKVGVRTRTELVRVALERQARDWLPVR